MAEELEKIDYDVQDDFDEDDELIDDDLKQGNSPN